MLGYIPDLRSLIGLEQGLVLAPLKPGHYFIMQAEVVLVYASPGRSQSHKGLYIRTAL